MPGAGKTVNGAANGAADGAGGRPVLIMAGGTGGHVYPALAVAQWLRAGGWPLLWLGSRDGLEAQVASRHGFRLLPVRIRPLRGRGRGRRALALLGAVAALFHSLWYLLRYRPSVVLGAGGAASGPGGLAAWLLRIPLCIHEQNTVPGLSNRLLARIATVAMEAYPGSFPRRNAATATTGNPVRAEIWRAAAARRQQRRRDAAELRLLVLGGSQGARTLNLTLPPAVHQLADRVRLIVRHQTGPDMREETRARYAELSGRVQLDAYIEDMAAAYGWADLAVCRAGALTLAELAAMGLAAILVPYPYAADDHQTSNASFFSRHGAAILLPEPECTPERLSELLLDLARHRQQRLAMAERSRELARPDATRAVAEICLNVRG
ncbi:MAG: undecaprenyldiphospho-muramoylpentapeptide beta-N-acetylglucosaminyltransferase [Gammaproteobacteria bacterium]|nr:undecaprenyldiphospho-muramoylpentapeptide beta-N-acetylglucosaminyltransferase [Gammaproteobacteria bacterium]